MAARQAVDELVDRLRLVAGGLEGRVEPEIGHLFDFSAERATGPVRNVLMPPNTNETGSLRAEGACLERYPLVGYGGGRWLRRRRGRLARCR